jgi:aminoglycoside phosphotransferase family enzyme/predicted kinase
VAVETTTQHEALIQSLMDPARWPSGGGNRRRIDTHISTVVLAGENAYKLKKPLDLGFLDFLTVESRHRACLEELRLNRRLAPQIYQAVCAITGSIAAPAIDGKGEVVDWAVRMTRFDPEAILSSLVDRLDRPLIDVLATRVARFHAEAAVCDPRDAYGDPQAVYAPMAQNIEQIRSRAVRFADHIEPLARWTAEQVRRLDAVLRKRKLEGHVRECHGDLHLGNVALIDGQPVVFDAIEFNPGLRWIDTVNDIGFMTMDLQERGRSDLAYRFLDRYLQDSGDYEGIAVLRFYEVYRALVRAKIAAIRTTQGDLDVTEQAAVATELGGYIGFARRLSEPREGALIITQGLSGSGKSHVSRTLSDFLPAVRLRSDIERKRILGVEPTCDATDQGAYSRDLTQQTYTRLAGLARTVIEAGYIAVVDATFLKREMRRRFRDLAGSLGVPFAIIDCDAPVATLRARIAARGRRADNVSDAGLRVLDAQLKSREPLSDNETAASVAVRPDRALDRQRLHQLLQR